MGLNMRSGEELSEVLTQVHFRHIVEKTGKKHMARFSLPSFVLYPTHNKVLNVGGERVNRFQWISESTIE